VTRTLPARCFFVHQSNARPVKQMSRVSGKGKKNWETTFLKRNTGVEDLPRITRITRIAFVMDDLPRITGGGFHEVWARADDVDDQGHVWCFYRGLHGWARIGPGIWSSVFYPWYPRYLWLNVFALLPRITRMGADRDLRCGISDLKRECRRMRANEFSSLCPELYRDFIDGWFEAR
jgi:hypothetical protein